MFEHTLHVLGEVERPISNSLVGEEIGDFVGPNVARVGPRRVKERPTRSIDSAYTHPIQTDEVVVDCLLIVWIRGQKATPAPAHTHDLVTFVLDTIYYGFDTSIESGDIPTARKNTYSHWSASLSLR